MTCYSNGRGDPTWSPLGSHIGLPLPIRNDLCPRVYRSVATLWMLLLVLPTARAADFDTKGTFFEPIKTLQEEKISLLNSRPESGVISIPYTRVDVAIDDGVAVTRVLQVYHNHGNRNEGFAFRMPMDSDTLISHFVLWDQGKRYVASIEERTRAEAVYRDVTGDEEPSRSRDPGLVRHDQNQFSMRVFPIVPGENKQIELIYHQRLSMKDGKFVLTIPLKEFSHPTDSRHGQVESQKTEVSLFIKDQLGVKNVEYGDPSLHRENIDEHRVLLKGNLPTSQSRDLSLSYEVDFSGRSQIGAKTFTHKDQNYFLMRVLHKPDEEERALSKFTEGESRHFYAGVWRNPDTEPISISDKELTCFSRLRLEGFAYTSLMMMEPGDAFHASYLPLKVKTSGRSGSKDDYFPKRGFLTSHLYSNKNPKEFQKLAFEEAFRGILTKPPSLTETCKHVKGAIDKAGCKFVFLFLDPPSARSEEKLLELIRAYPDIDFVLITEQEALSSKLFVRSNVSSFTLEEGWKSVKFRSARRHALMPHAGMNLEQICGFMQLDGSRMLEFLQKLPHANKALPTIRAGDDILLRDIETARNSMSGEDFASKKMRLIWVTGRFEGESNSEWVQLEVPTQLPSFNETSPGGYDGMAGATPFKVGNATDRYVASFHARRKSENLMARIEITRELMNSGKEVTFLEARLQEAKLEELRKRVVGLSRDFSFICPETAFIALPPELQKQYGMTPQEYEAQQIYNFKSMAGGGAPEPSEWALLISATVLLYLTFRRTREKAAASC